MRQRAPFLVSRDGKQQASRLTICNYIHVLPAEPRGDSSWSLAEPSSHRGIRLHVAEQASLHGRTRIGQPLHRQHRFIVSIAFGIGTLTKDSATVGQLLGSSEGEHQALRLTIGDYEQLLHAKSRGASSWCQAEHSRHRGIWLHVAEQASPHGRTLIGSHYIFSIVFYIGTLKKDSTTAGPFLGSTDDEHQAPRLAMCNY